MEPAQVTSRTPPPGQRQARRRRETIEEILRLSVEIMGQVGAGGLTFAELARRLGVRPPSLYKYFGSVLAVCDELFRRGQQEHGDAVAEAMGRAEPGMPAVFAGLLAGARWTVENPVLSQLLFWRPIPGFQPSPEAFAPSLEMVGWFRSALGDAVAAGQLRPEGASDQALLLVSVLASGIASQYMANEPGQPFNASQYMALVPAAVEMFTRAYAASAAPGRRGTATGG